MFNLTHKVLPRISQFDEIKLRRMILICANPAKGSYDYSKAPTRHPQQICYMRSTWDMPPENTTISAAVSNKKYKPSPSMPSPPLPPFHPSRSAHKPITASFVPESTNDISDFIHANYPKLASHQLGLLFKKHSAVGAQQHNYLKNSILQENAAFIQSLISILSDSCICCSLRSLPCIFEDTGGYTTPKNTVIPAKSSIDSARSWAETIVSGIVLFSDDLPGPNDAVLFGETSPQVPSVLEPQHIDYTTDHWTKGKVLPKPPIAVIISIARYMLNIPKEEMDRPWITHSVPRFILMLAKPIREQLFAGHMLDHELCLVVVRSLQQIDTLILYNLEHGCYRHFFEVDFSTSILSGAKITDNKSIQLQFMGKHIRYNIANCRLFIAPAILEVGWCAYIWDMKKKTIYIIDPTVSIHEYAIRKKMHFAIADRLHISLYLCFFNYYSSWHVDCANWKKIFEIYNVEDHFSKVESGIAMI